MKKSVFLREEKFMFWLGFILGWFVGGTLTMILIGLLKLAAKHSY